MPVLIAGLIRSAIQFAVTLGIVEVATRFILPLINKAIAEVIQVFGIPEDEAIDIVANSWLETAEQIGIGALAIKSKTPTKIAERLRFTSKGFAKRPIKTSTAAKVSAGAGATVVAAKQIPKLTTGEATAVIEGAKSSLSGFKTAYDFLFKFLGILFLGGMVIANWIDFGNWNNGAYQKRMQKFIALITFGLLIPDADYRKAKTASPEIFDKVFNAYKLQGVVGINDPFKQATVPFTRDNLLDIVDQVGAALLVTEQKASTKDVLLATASMMIFGAEQPQTTTETTAKIRKPIQPINRPSVSFQETSDDLVNLALGKVAKFLNNFAGRLDFELTTRTNPIDETGKFLSGKYYTLQIRLRSGQFGKTKLDEAILRPLAEGEKPFKPIEEEPFEAALREAAGVNIPVTALADIAEIPLLEPLNVPPRPTPKNYPEELENSLLKYAIWNGNFITDFRADVHLPFELAKEPAQGRSVDLTPEITRQLKIDIATWTGETDENIINYIRDTITEYRRNDHLRSLLSSPSFAQFGGHEKIAQDYGGLVEFGLFLLNKRRKTNSNKISNAGKPPYVQFKGSPDIFDRRTGDYIDGKEAVQFNVFAGGKIEQIPTSRPEVTNVTEYAAWSGKNLTQFPI